MILTDMMMLKRLVHVARPFIFSQIYKMNSGTQIYLAALTVAIMMVVLVISIGQLRQAMPPMSPPPISPISPIPVTNPTSPIIVESTPAYDYWPAAPYYWWYPWGNTSGSYGRRFNRPPHSRVWAPHVPPHPSPPSPPFHGGGRGRGH